MITGLAFKNILGNGWRSLINVVILSIVLTGMIWMQGIYDGWGRLARRQMQEWEFGSGHFVQKDYDKYDSFTWDDSQAEIPSSLQQLIKDDKAVPILYSSGVLYPQGRMTPVLVKGIPAGQTVLSIPSAELKETDTTSGFVPALIGSQMAKSSRLQEGDIVTLRWKDVNGVYNAADLIIARVIATPVPTVDVSQVWIDFDRLNEARALENNATILVFKNKPESTDLGADWRYVSTDEAMAGTDAMINAKRAGGYVLFTLLLFLSMIAIFDTQILAIFKRRKEIGTLIALGLTKQQIIRLFTLEGILYMIMGTIFTGTVGLPFFYYFATKGYPMPQEMTGYNIAGMSEAIQCYYSPGMVTTTVLIVLAVTAFASWLPTARIARMKATDALLGKV